MWKHWLNKMFKKKVKTNLHYLRFYKKKSETHIFFFGLDQYKSWIYHLLLIWKSLLIKTIWLLLKIAYLVIINIIWSCIKELRTKVLKYQTKVLKMNSSSKQELLYVGKVIKALPCLLDEFIFSTLVRYFSTLVHNFGTVIRNIHNNCLGIALWNVTWNRLYLHLSTHLKHSHGVGYRAVVYEGEACSPFIERSVF